MEKLNNELHKNYIQYENTHKIQHIIDANNNSWFNCNDCMKALDYNDKWQALATHVPQKYRSQFQYLEIDDENILIHPQTVFITESGFYRLMASSRVPYAEKFRDWIFDEVLPAIRQYGFYMKNKEKDDIISDLHGQINDLMKTTKEEKIKKKQYKKLFIKARKNNDELIIKINEIKLENEKINKDYIYLRENLNRKKYEKGGVCYAISINQTHPIDLTKIRFKLGKTDDLTLRVDVYDSHNLTRGKILAVKKNRQS